MKTSTKSVSLVFLLFLLSGCTPASTPPPTSVPLTFTHSPIPPTFTPEPTATITPTITPIPTPTLPFEIPSSTTGTGTVMSLVQWNDEPVKAQGKLCKGIDDTSNCYSAKSNDFGYLIFENVEPGVYVLKIVVFSSGWIQILDESGKPVFKTVEADKIIFFDPVDVVKGDLKTTYPHGSGAVVVIEIQPTLKWEEYPNAAYYIVQLTSSTSLASCQSDAASGTCNPDVVSPKIEGGQTSFLVSPPLVVDNYYFWGVDAYNKSGTKIAEGFGDSFYVLNP